MKKQLKNDAAVLKKEPIQGRAQRTLDTLLEAAAQFIERDQEDKFTTNRIAERAGFSIGTLYQYFPNKEAILLALARRFSKRFIQEMSESSTRAIGEGKDVYEILRDNIHLNIDMYGRGWRKKRWLVRLVWGLESTAISAEFADASANGMAQLLRTANDPRLRDPNPVQLFLISRAFQGIIRSAALEDSPLLDDPTFEEEVVAMVWGMLLRDRPSTQHGIRFADL